MKMLVLISLCVCTSLLGDSCAAQFIIMGKALRDFQMVCAIEFTNIIASYRTIVVHSSDAESAPLTPCLWFSTWLF